MTTPQAGQGLSVLYSGLASGFVGLWQINVQLSQVIPAGEPVQLRIATGGDRVVFPLPIIQ